MSKSMDKEDQPVPAAPARLTLPLLPVMAAYICAAITGGLGLAAGFSLDGGAVGARDLPLFIALVAFVGGILFIPAFLILTRNDARSYFAWGCAGFVAGQPWWWIMSMANGYPGLGLSMLAASAASGLAFRFCLSRYIRVESACS